MNDPLLCVRNNALGEARPGVTGPPSLFRAFHAMQPRHQGVAHRRHTGGGVHIPCVLTQTSRVQIQPPLPKLPKLSRFQSCPLQNRDSDNICPHRCCEHEMRPHR